MSNDLRRFLKTVTKSSNGPWVVKGEEMRVAWTEVFKKVVVEMKGEYDEEFKKKVGKDVEKQEEEKEPEEGRNIRYKDGYECEYDARGSRESNSKIEER